MIYLSHTYRPKYKNKMLSIANSLLEFDTKTLENNSNILLAIPESIKHIICKPVDCKSFYIDISNNLEAITFLLTCYSFDELKTMLENLYLATNSLAFSNAITVLEIDYTNQIINETEKLKFLVEYQNLEIRQLELELNYITAKNIKTATFANLFIEKN